MMRVTCLAEVATSETEAPRGLARLQGVAGLPSTPPTFLITVI